MTDLAAVRSVVDAAIRWAHAKERLLAAQVTGEPPDMAEYVDASLTLERVVHALGDYPGH